MHVTRLRPTPYADLHLGHVWVALHNWELARQSGGKFVLIFDDIMHALPNLAVQSFGLQTATERYLEDLAWLGMAPDEVVYSTRNAEAHAEAAERLGLARIGQAQNYKQWPVSVADFAGSWIGYHPWLVAVRVIDDALAGVTGFFRGKDLISETQLYDYICRRLGLRTPGQQYIKLVRREASAEKESKSNKGGISVRDMRDAGYRPAQIVETLRECERLSGVARLEDVVIPDGVLETEEVKVLLHNSPEVNATDHLGYPWETEVRAFRRRDRARQKKALMQKGGD